jgi:hypothetical protein
MPFHFPTPYVKSVDIMALFSSQQLSVLFFIEETVTIKILFFLNRREKRFDRGNCNSPTTEALLSSVQQSKRGGKDRRKPAVPGTDFICYGYILNQVETNSQPTLCKADGLPPKLTSTFSFFFPAFSRVQTGSAFFISLSISPA